MTRVEKVLRELQEALKGKRYWVHNHEVNTGWVPNFRLVSPEVGSISGLRALRKLKEYDYSYEKKSFIDPSTGKYTGVTLYKLTSPYPGNKASQVKDKPKFLSRDISQSNEKRIAECELCGAEEGVPKGFLKHLDGVKFCECHPDYRKK